VGSGVVVLVVEWLLGTQRDKRDAEYYEQLKTRGA